MAINLTPGQVLNFKKANVYQIAQYGATATFIETSISVSRPYGFQTWWYEFVTANGTKLQWDVKTVKRSFMARDWER